jgi:hypothetical protein
VDDSQDLILDCPLCGKQHTYPVSIKRSVYIGWMTPSRQEEQRKRSIERLFVCPDRGGRFVATLSLIETSMAPIREVTVGDARGPRDEQRD